MSLLPAAVTTVIYINIKATAVLKRIIKKILRNEIGRRFS